MSFVSSEMEAVAAEESPPKDGVGSEESPEQRKGVDQLENGATNTDLLTVMNSESPEVDTTEEDLPTEQDEQKIVQDNEEGQEDGDIEVVEDETKQGKKTGIVEQEVNEAGDVEVVDAEAKLGEKTDIVEQKVEESADTEVVSYEVEDDEVVEQTEVPEEERSSDENSCLRSGTSSDKENLNEHAGNSEKEDCVQSGWVSYSEEDLYESGVSSEKEDSVQSDGNMDEQAENNGEDEWETDEEDVQDVVVEHVKVQDVGVVDTGSSDDAKKNDSRSKSKGLIFCDVCNLYCRGERAYENHIKGLFHSEQLKQKAELPAEITTPAPKEKSEKDTDDTKKTPVKCQICKRNFRNKGNLKKHYLNDNGHRKKLRTAVGRSDLTDILINLDLENHTEPLLGLDHIVEQYHIGQDLVLSYQCMLCGLSKMEFGSVFRHIKGLTHRTNYLVKFYQDWAEKVVKEDAKTQGRVAAEFASEVEKIEGRKLVSTVDIVVEQTENSKTPGKRNKQKPPKDKNVASAKGANQGQKKLTDNKPQSPNKRPASTQRRIESSGKKGSGGKTDGKPGPEQKQKLKSGSYPNGRQHKDIARMDNFGRGRARGRGRGKRPENQPPPDASWRPGAPGKFNGRNNAIWPVSHYDHLPPRRHQNMMGMPPVMSRDVSSAAASGRGRGLLMRSMANGTMELNWSNQRIAKGGGINMENNRLGNGGFNPNIGMGMGNQGLGGYPTGTRYRMDSKNYGIGMGSHKNNDMGFDEGLDLSNGYDSLAFYEGDGGMMNQMQYGNNGYGVYPQNLWQGRGRGNNQRNVDQNRNDSGRGRGIRLKQERQQTGQKEPTISNKEAVSKSGKGSYTKLKEAAGKKSVEESNTKKKLVGMIQNMSDGDAKMILQFAGAVAKNN